MLTIIRGLPGSGKSTLAKKLCELSPGTLHYEADMFFEQSGSYVFDASKLGRAHGWCKNHTLVALARGINVVVSNTFTTWGEIDDYVLMARDFKTQVEVIEATEGTGSIHGVPDESMERMRDRWEPTEEILDNVQNTLYNSPN